MKRRILPKGIFNLVFLFSLTLGLGIFTGLKLNEFLEIQEKKVELVSFWQFVLNFVLALFVVGAILFLSKRLKKRKKNLFKILFLVSVAIGAIVSLGVFLGDFALVVVFILIFFWVKKPNVLLQNILVMVGIAGAGAYLGTRLEPLTVILLLVIFSLYDYIAVYKTKHMVKMAKEMIEQGAILGLVLPQKPADFLVSLKEVKPGGERFFILGGGDVVFPLMLCSSLVDKSVFNAFFVAGFSLVGLFFSFLVFSKKKQAIPALPPIAFFSLLGFLITLF